MSRSDGDRLFSLFCLIAFAAVFVALHAEKREPGRSLPVGPGLGARVEVEALEKCGFCESDSCAAEPGACHGCCDVAGTPEVEKCKCADSPAARQ